MFSLACCAPLVRVKLTAFSPACQRPRQTGFPRRPPRGRGDGRFRSRSAQPVLGVGWPEDARGWGWRGPWPLTGALCLGWGRADASLGGSLRSALAAMCVRMRHRQPHPRPGPVHSPGHRDTGLAPALMADPSLETAAPSAVPETASCKRFRKGSLGWGFRLRRPPWRRLSLSH